MSSFRASSEESVSTLRIRRRKRPYTPFFVVTEKQAQQPAADQYGADNTTYFTLSVSHGGILRDRPGKTYRKSTVTYFAAVNVDRLDLHELSLLSRHLGYPTMWKWYYFREEPHASLDLLPLSTEHHIEAFRQVIRYHHFAQIEKLYVEHGPAGEQYKLIPKEIMESGKKRIEKLLYLLLVQKPEATVAEGVERVESMTRLKVSTVKIERAMQHAREHLGMC